MKPKLFTTRLLEADDRATQREILIELVEDALKEFASLVYYDGIHRKDIANWLEKRGVQND